MKNATHVFVLIAVLGLAQVAVAQCPVPVYTGGQNVESRLSAVEAQVGTLNTRMDRVERLVTRLAEVSGNLVANQSVMGRGPAESDYRLVSLAQETPAVTSPSSGILSQGESGRVEFRCFGAANVRLALAGGGYVAVGNEAARATTSVASADDPFSSSVGYVPSYYRKRAQQKAAIQQASYYPE
jgi:hypothetical protein